MPKGRVYRAEFRVEAVRLARLSGRPLRAMAAEFGVSPESLRRWVIQVDIDAGRSEGLASEEARWAAAAAA